VSTYITTHRGTRPPKASDDSTNATPPTSWRRRSSLEVRRVRSGFVYEHGRAVERCVGSVKVRQGICVLTAVSCAHMQSTILSPRSYCHNLRERRKRKVLHVQPVPASPLIEARDKGTRCRRKPTALVRSRGGSRSQRPNSTARGEGGAGECEGAESNERVMRGQSQCTHGDERAEGKARAMQWGQRDGNAREMSGN
jgi:hypothetical protein